MNIVEALKKISNKEYCAKNESLGLCLTVCQDEIYSLLSGGGCGKGIKMSYNIVMSQDWTISKMNDIEKKRLNDGIEFFKKHTDTCGASAC